MKKIHGFSYVAKILICSKKCFFYVNVSSYIFKNRKTLLCSENESGQGYWIFFVLMVSLKFHEKQTTLRNSGFSIWWFYFKFGIPSRVCTNKGKENALVLERMIELRGPNRGSYLTGSSIRNQRIERLWKDVWNTVCSEFYYTFKLDLNYSL